MAAPRRRRAAAAAGAARGGRAGARRPARARRARGLRRSRPAPARRAAVLYTAVQRGLPARVERIAALARIERARWRFFARAESAGPFVGGVGTHPAMAARVGGGTATPLGARHLEVLANCRFAFFAQKVLGVGELDEAGQAPDAREVGTLAHQALERFYTRRHNAGKLPVSADDEEKRELEACLDEVFTEDAEEKPGHPILRAIERQRLSEQLWRLIEHESTHGAEIGGGTPRFFELMFGEDHEKSLPALRIGPDEAPVYVRGRIDRVDVLPGRAGIVVLDYKLGRRDSQSKKLAEGEAAVTQLQLPIYALAARQGLIGTGELVDGASVDAAFISLRDGVPTKLLSQALKNPPMAEVLAQHLPARLDQLATQLHAGDFAVDPRDCAYCSFRTVCRVVALREDEDDVR
jgi:ATP-dependent helicase/nuclease subunit B